MSSETTQVKKSELTQLIDANFDEATIRAYFKFLCADENEIFTVAFLFDGLSGEHEKGNVPGYGTYHGKIDDILAKLSELRAQFGIDVSLHVTVNRTNLIGRKTKDIESSRVLCVDLDGVEQEKLDDALAHKPALIVQSSENGSGKFHVYWQIEGRSLETWKLLQLGLAYRFGGDLNLDQVTKTIRVPGVARITKSGAIFTPKMVNLPDSVKCEPGVELFPWANEAYEAAKEARQLGRKALNKLMSEVQAGKHKPQSLQEIAASGRNNFLYWAVKKAISRFTPGVALSCIEDAFSVGNSINKGFSEPLGESEVESTVKSAYEKGSELWQLRKAKYLERLGKMSEQQELEAHPMLLSEHSANGSGNVNGEVKLDFESFDYDHKDPWVSLKSFSDYDLAARVLQRFGEDIVKSENELIAFSYQENKWKLQTRTSSEVYTMVRRIIKDLREDTSFRSAFCLDKKGEFKVELLAKAMARFESQDKANSIVATIVKSAQVKTMYRGDFDTNDSEMNVKNGILNLATGELREVGPSDYVISCAGAVYNKDANCPGWLEFLNQIYNKDQELIAFVQQVVGYSLQGAINEQLLFCHYGAGANGKSTFLGVLGKLMGDYSCILGPDDLSIDEKSFKKAFEQTASKIEGHRLVIVDDMDGGEKVKWNESMVKNLTSRVLQARRLYQDPREIINRAKVHLGFNKPPYPESESFGLLRRLCFIPYLKRFPGGSTEAEKLEAMANRELSGILNWAIAGFRNWKEAGKLILPDACREAISEYREENFSVETLITQYLEIVESKKEEFFHTTESLLPFFNHKLSKLGGKTITARALGAAITAALDPLIGREARHQGQKRGFYLKLKFDKSNILLDDIED